MTQATSTGRHRRHGEQDRSGAARACSRAHRSSWPTRAQTRASWPASWPAKTWARCSSPTRSASKRANTGSLSRCARAAHWCSTRARSPPSSSTAAACCPSASSACAAISAPGDAVSLLAPDGREIGRGLARVGRHGRRRGRRQTQRRALLVARQRRRSRGGASRRSRARVRRRRRLIDRASTASLRPW